MRVVNGVIARPFQDHQQLSALRADEGRRPARDVAASPEGCDVFAQKGYQLVITSVAWTVRGQCELRRRHAVIFA